MLHGITTINLDAKGRLAIPTRYREDLVRNCEGKMVLTVDSQDRCLLLYPEPEWEEVERKLVRLPALNKHSRRLQRLLIGHASECQIDNNGRILLSPPLREFAELDKATVLIGQGNKFEIWSDKNWTVHRDETLSMNSDPDGELPEEFGSLSL